MRFEANISLFDQALKSGITRQEAVSATGAVVQSRFSLRRQSMMRIPLALILLAGLLPASAGAEIFGEPESVTTVPHYNPEGEAVRSLVLPGWSQFRQGHENAGFGYAAVAVITLMFLTGVVDAPFVNDDDDNFGQVLAGVLYGVNAVVSGFDAQRRASESNREHGWDFEEQALRTDPNLRLSIVRVRF
jgi:hypothetical protein